ncbi:DUF6279 family lipoprotein [Pseudomonas sp.]|uniref:DUF6279 family lipoprotein n=1 Tax=Pseudomonas sp. TaxID=306 RepID=UPI0028AD7835|nr:DUF6279 family lipoprotein [Pseudomonas sp.]
MHTRSVPGYKFSLLLVMAMVVALSGCSRLNLAYRNLHILIPWSLGDYLDLNREQQARFRDQLREHLAWHCRTQLPNYLDALAILERQVREGRIDEPTLRTHYRQAKAAVRTIAVAITPTAVELLQSLDDRQVRGLDQAFERDRREHGEEYLQPPPVQQINDRAERTRKRVEQWLGSTNPAQRERIRAWARTLAGQNRYWLANRAQWQHALIDALEPRHAPGFEARISTLLQDREALWTDDYRAAFGRTEAAAFDLVTALYANADERQRRHLAEELDALRSDLASLNCLPGSR